MDAYNPTAANATAAVRSVKEAEWKRKLNALNTFNGACAGAKDLLIFRVQEDDVVAMKQLCVGYGGMNTNKMMEHIRNKTCIKMTTI